MNSLASDIHWLPNNPERFIAWGSEISLFQVKKILDFDPRNYSGVNIELSNTTCASLLATESRYQHIRSVAPSYHNVGEIIAIGLANGKVGLTNFASSTDSSREYIPKQSRACTSLAWNEFDTNILGIGHDRYRSDNCITIWDTERGLPKDKSICNSYGVSETAHSMCWEKQTKLLVAGMSYKYIKLIDIRQPNILASTANTRAVYGICSSPSGRILASYIDNLISVWDIRNMEKAISSIQTEKNINNLSWCTTRSNTLATLQRDSSYISLIDLHWSAAGENEIEPHIIKRNIAPFHTKPVANSKGPTLSSISWHPNDVERLLIVFGTGAISDFKIQQRVAISWDPYNNLCGSVGINLNYINTASPPSTPTEIISPQWDNQNSTEKQFPKDIADLIHRRALLDYGKLSDIKKNGDLAQNPMLKSVWKLLAIMSNEDCLLGLKSVLGISNSSEGLQMVCSESVNSHWEDFPLAPPVKIFRSSQRDLASILCGWNFDTANDENLNNFLVDLCNKKEFTRAALIAGFQLRIRQAIQILGKGAETSSDSNNLRMAAIALSGLNFEKSAMWRSQCSVAHTQIKDPHLRAFFAFLTPDNDSYDEVLKESGLSVSDRLAFACQFLCDTKLAEYVKDMIKICIELGDLNGLLLTGTTNEGITLLQSYLNWTDDVQTVALISTKFLSKDLITDYAVQYWISSYRELLDVWGLWEQRAHFDVTMGQTRSPPRYSRSVFLQCSFCGKSVSATLQEQITLRTTTSGVNKLSSCPNCHKPLPRCSLCLLHMGTSTGASISQNNIGQTNCGWQSKPFSKWFSWCQTCRHGGHTEHLSNWFSEHVECPVASCSCKCFALDMSIPKFPK